MDLSNPLEVVEHYLLIKGMASLGYRDGFPTMSALVLYGYTLDRTFNESWLKAIK